MVPQADAMTADYSFEKKSVYLLALSILALMILVFFLGLLVGLGIERSEPKTNVKTDTSEPVKQSTAEAEAPADRDVQAQKTDLSQEIEPKPVTPEFKEVSPQAEQPSISQPKKE